MLIRRCFLGFPRERNLRENVTFFNETSDPGRLAAAGSFFTRSAELGREMAVVVGSLLPLRI